MRRTLMMIAMVVAFAIPYTVAQQSGSAATAKTSSTDSALQSKVQSALSADASFRNVAATVQEGVVDLYGSVPSQPDQKRAKDLVSKIPGVEAVNEHLSIGEAGAAASTTAGAAVPQTAQSETTKNTAGSIAGNAGAIGTTTGDTTPTNPAVETHSAAGNNAPKSTIVQDSQTQSSQSAAPNSQNAASSGASLGMTPDADSNTLRSEIDSALKSDPTLGSSQLSVDVNESQITLSGSVPSGKEKQTAVRIAQSYAGNRKVNDKVTLVGKQQAPNSQKPDAMGTNPK